MLTKLTNKQPLNHQDVDRIMDYIVYGTMVVTIVVFIMQFIKFAF
jgi:hypothetical protein